ncbi:hypothetical protein Tco_0209985 [Tanacetum coccineum]
MLTTYINHGEHLLPSSTSAKVGKKLEWTRFICLVLKSSRIENKYAKKTNKMSYPRFTKIIIDYFMSKDLSISRRNKMFWHTARDDTMFTSMRCISRHEDTQKAPKPKYIQKKAGPDTSPKQKPVQATKGTRLKLKAKVANSHASSIGDGVDTQSKVPDEQKQKTSGTDKRTGIIPGVPDVPIYESKSEKESWGDSEDEDEDEDDENDSDDLSGEGDDDNNGNDGDGDDDDKQEGDDTNDNDEETEKEENIDDEEMMYDDEDDEVTKEFYEDVNNADEPVQSSFVSSNFTSKLLNLKNPSPFDNEIASLMETLARHATAVPDHTSNFTTTIPPPLPLQPGKRCVRDKQVDQYAQALFFIFTIVDRYMDNKLGEAINKAIQAHNLDYIQEAQDEKNAYIELVDTSIRALIKEEVNTQLP